MVLIEPKDLKYLSFRRRCRYNSLFNCLLCEGLQLKDIKISRLWIRLRSDFVCLIWMSSLPKLAFSFSLFSLSHRSNIVELLRKLA